MERAQDFSYVPIIDVSGLVAGMARRQAVSTQLGEACRESGFFYAVGHGVDEGLQRRLRELSRQFFAQDVDTKMQLRMALGGRAWRGYFRVGDELTSGRPDQMPNCLPPLELTTMDCHCLSRQVRIQTIRQE
jgi:isopenicillin N synthase-like dioxygenase